MNINWKIRIKNPIFVLQLVLSVITPIAGYMGISPQDVTSWPVLGSLILAAISNPYVLLLVAVSLWNCINDPTTSGVSDSARALTYSCTNSVK